MIFKEQCFAWHLSPVNDATYQCSYQINLFVLENSRHISFSCVAFLCFTCPPQLYLHFGHHWSYQLYPYTQKHLNCEPFFFSCPNTSARNSEALLLHCSSKPYTQPYQVHSALQPYCLRFSGGNVKSLMSYRYHPKETMHCYHHFGSVHWCLFWLNISKIPLTFPHTDGNLFWPRIS